MARSIFKHAIGCWVRQFLPDSGVTRTGIVIKVVTKDSGDDLVVAWIEPERIDGVVNAAVVTSGFRNGMEVKDVTPGTGIRSLGVGFIMQQRELAGSQQALVDFPESGSRHWLPYQYLKQVKGPEYRFKTAAACKPSDAECLRLRMLAYALETWNENTGALSSLDIDPLPHQINLVHHILASGNLNWLIADDVGLGKTIETGMLLHALNQRELTKRVLLITPAGLTKQWQEELYHKFKLEDYEIYGDDFSINDVRQWKMHDHVIGSLDRLKKDEHLVKLLSAEPWDLVIFDEGHRLTRRQYGHKLDSSERYDLAAKLRKKTKSMLLLSATPHQGMHDKFVALLELLRPERRRDLLSLQLKPEVLHDMVYRNHKADVTDVDGNFIFQGKITKTVNVPASAESIEFDKTLQEYLRQGYSAGVSKGRTGNAIGFVMTVYRKLAASSVAAILSALNRRRLRIEKKINDEAISDDGFEERFFGEWEEIVKSEAVEFFEGELVLLGELISKAEALVSLDQKIESFMTQVVSKVLAQNSREKVLVFTEYRSTQDYIRNALANCYGECNVAVINGSMTHTERQSAIQNFEENGQFLISTEAGGEGINLQRRCHIMINYDLPWNPMRLVQRIGRLYRYGQKMKVVVFNIHQPDTLDEQIVDLLYERIDAVVNDMAAIQGNEFNDGLKDEILGELADLIDVDGILEEATVQGIQRTKQRIEDALQQAKLAASKQRELFQYAARGEQDSILNKLDITTKHLLAFVEGMCEILNVEIIEKSHSGKVLRLRLSDVVKEELGMSSRVSGRIDVTVDRDLAITLKNVQVLDLNSVFVKYLLDRARDYDFGGLAACLGCPELGQGALFGAILRWQSVQGTRMRQEFVAVSLDGQKVTENNKRISDWLLRRVEGDAFAVDSERSKKAFESAELVLKRRLRDATNQYMIPENLQWVAAAWVGA